MVDCPQCGKPMVKQKHRGKYFCENESCSVVFVQQPHRPSRMRIALSGLAVENSLNVRNTS